MNKKIIIPIYSKRRHWENYSDTNLKVYTGLHKQIKKVPSQLK